MVVRSRCFELLAKLRKPPGLGQKLAARFKRLLEHRERPGNLRDELPCFSPLLRLLLVFHGQELQKQPQQQEKNKLASKLR